MKKIEFIPCLCVLNITSWAGYSPGAEHVYGRLTLVEQHNSPDYDPISIDNIEEWAPNGKDIELRKRLTLEDARLLDEKSGGRTYQLSVQRGTPTYTNRFNTINEVTKAGVKKFKQLKLNCDFISLYEGEKFKDSIIIKGDEKH